MERLYDFLSFKEYEAFGYRWRDKKLPPWIRIGIKTDQNNKQLIVYSKIHKNKTVKLLPKYNNSFTDLEIIKDMSETIKYKFL